MKVKMFFVYILKSDYNQTFYYGHTKDLESRLRNHNAGRVRSTKSKRPWRIHYYEEYATKSEAYRRELYFKSFDGYRFLKEESII